MKTIKFLSLLALLLCFLGSCSSDDSSNNDMPNPNTGIDNYIVCEISDDLHNEEIN